MTIVGSNLGRLSCCEVDCDFFLVSRGVVRGVKRLAESRTNGIVFPVVTSMLALWLKSYN